MATNAVAGAPSPILDITEWTPVDSPTPENLDKVKKKRFDFWNKVPIPSRAVIARNELKKTEGGITIIDCVEIPTESNQTPVKPACKAQVGPLTIPIPPTPHNRKKKWEEVDDLIPRPYPPVASPAPLSSPGGWLSKFVKEDDEQEVEGAENLEEARKKLQDNASQDDTGFAALESL